MAQGVAPDGFERRRQALEDVLIDFKHQRGTASAGEPAGVQRDDAPRLLPTMDHIGREVPHLAR